MTRLEALNAILAKVCPEAFAAASRTGAWPGGRAPYDWTVHDGQQRVRVTSPDGDVFSGVGATKDDALAALAKKVGVELAS